MSIWSSLAIRSEAFVLAHPDRPPLPQVLVRAMASLHELGSVNASPVPPSPTSPRPAPCAAFSCTGCGPRPRWAAMPSTGAQVPDIDGNDFDLASLAGSVVCVVNVACE